MHMHVPLCMYVYTYMYMYSYRYLYVYVCMYVYIYICMYVCMYVSHAWIYGKTYVNLSVGVCALMSLLAYWCPGV